MASLNNNMFKVILSVILFLGLALTPQLSYGQQPNKKLHQQCIYPILLVSPDDANSFGTGFIVRSSKVEDKLYCNVFFTCAHVTSESGHYEVKLYEYEDWSKIKSTKTFKALITAKNPAMDIAVGIFLSETPLPTVTLDFNPKLYIGNKVRRVGCGMGDDPRLDEGKISSVRTDMGRLKEVIRTSIPTVPGDSGSPVYQKYKVIGLTQSIRAWKGFPVYHMSYIIPLERFKIWDKELKGAIGFAWTIDAFPSIEMWQLNFYRNYDNSEFP